MKRPELMVKLKKFLSQVFRYESGRQTSVEIAPSQTNQVNQGQYPLSNFSVQWMTVTDIEKNCFGDWLNRKLRSVTVRNQSGSGCR